VSEGCRNGALLVPAYWLCEPGDEFAVELVSGCSGRGARGPEEHAGGSGARWVVREVARLCEWLLYWRAGVALALWVASVREGKLKMPERRFACSGLLAHGVGD
jgi:hypothetical protein